MLSRSYSYTGTAVKNIPLNSLLENCLQSNLKPGQNAPLLYSTKYTA
jgi:hypothetical protein